MAAAQISAQVLKYVRFLHFACDQLAEEISIGAGRQVFGLQGAYTE